MVNEYIEVQDYNKVQEIDSRREISNVVSDQIETQITNMETINNQLDNIATAINETQIPVSDVDLTEVNDKLDSLDNTIITTNTENTIEMINDLQNQINSIEEKINTILDKINEL